MLYIEPARAICLGSASINEPVSGHWSRSMSPQLNNQVAATIAWVLGHGEIFNVKSICSLGQ